MKRLIQSIQSCVTTIPVNTTEEDVHVWLKQQAQENNLCWLLAHADDGVIWGEMRDDQELHLSSETHPAISPKLRWLTLQQCRFFGEYGELFLWKGPNGWKARLRSDSKGDLCECIDEHHLLWGTSSDNTQPINGFLSFREGSQGIVHVPPLTTLPTKKDRAKLHVRHYLTCDKETGMVSITSSRLVKLIAPKGASK